MSIPHKIGRTEGPRAAAEVEGLEGRQRRDVMHVHLVVCINVRGRGGEESVRGGEDEGHDDVCGCGLHIHMSTYIQNKRGKGRGKAHRVVLEEGDEEGEHDAGRPDGGRPRDALLLFVLRPSVGCLSGSEGSSCRAFVLIPYLFVFKKPQYTSVRTSGRSCGMEDEEEEEEAGSWKTAPSLPLERTRRAACGWEAGRGGISTACTSSCVHK